MNNKSSKNNKSRQAKVNNKPNTNKEQPVNKEENIIKLAKTETKQSNINAINDTKNQTNKSTTSEVKTETKPITNQNTPTTKQDLAHNNNITPEKQPEKSNKKKNIISACVILGVTFLVAILGRILGGKMVEGRINPPAYPPEWVFPMAWSILYILIGIATYLVYKNSTNKQERKCTMTWYAVHLFFNLFWPMFYFRLDMLIMSTVWLLFIVITAIVLTFKYFKNNLVSGWLFTLYTLWLLYAMYLNLAITLLNLG